MSHCFDDLESTIRQPPRLQQSVYQKDLTSIQKMVFHFKTAYQHKLLSPSQFNSYHKNAHQIQILLNSFLKNSFNVLSKKDMLDCLRNWETLVYDQNKKTKYMIERYLQMDSELQQHNRSLIQKVTSTCERCYQDTRKVNIEEVKNCLENQYMGTLDRMIAEAKMQINGQLFAEQEDQMFFKQLHNILKKKHQQIEFNNKSIEALIDKITKEISDLNIMKKIAIQECGELEPLSYTWMRNIKSALNDLLQSTFKKKVPMFIENMVKLFEENLAERNRLLLRPMHTQTDDYENLQIVDLKEKIIKINGTKFKLQNDLKWVEHQLQNTKKQFTQKIQEYKKQLEEKWTELIEQKENNKRLKAMIEVITKQTDAVKEELRKKIQFQKRKAKSSPKFQNEKDLSQFQATQTQTQTNYLKESMSQSVKNKFSFQRQNKSKPQTAQKSSHVPDSASQKISQKSQKIKQRFKQGQQQSRQKSKIPVAKSGLKFRKSQRNNPNELKSINLKRRISEATLIPNHELVERKSEKQEDDSSTSSKIGSLDVEQNEQEQHEEYETQQGYEEKQESETQPIENHNQEETPKNLTNSVQRPSKQKFRTNKLTKSIIIEEENSETMSNYATPNNEKPTFTQALESFQKNLRKSSQPSQPSNQRISQSCDQNQSNSGPQEKLNNDSNVKTFNDSEFRESFASMKPQRKYNQEIVRVNQLMEKRIKRSGIMLPIGLSKQSQITVKTSNKLLNEFNNQMKIDQKPQEDTIVEMNPNIFRKNHFKSQTMLNNYNFKLLKGRNLNFDQQHETQTEKSQTRNDFFGKNAFRDSEPNNCAQNFHKASLKKMFDTQNFNKDLEELMKQIKDKIKIHQEKSEIIQESAKQSIIIKSLMINFFQKYGINGKQLTQDNQNLIKIPPSFERKANKSVSFFKEDQSAKTMKLNRANGFVKKIQPQQQVQNSLKKLPIMYKTCFNTPNNNQDNNKIGKKTSTHNLLKRNVWKSLPDESDPQNQQSIEKAKLNNKSQRPLLKDIKNYGHKKYESCEIQNKEKTKFDIFTKEDLDLFIDEANAYSYECAHMKRQPKHLDSQQALEYQGLIDNIFMNIEEIKDHSSVFYDQIVSFIRYPYHTVKNLSWGACMVKGIKYESFVKFMERIIYLHRNCPIFSELGYCAHLNIFSRKIQFVKQQAATLSK